MASSAFSSRPAASKRAGGHSCVVCGRQITMSSPGTGSPRDPGGVSGVTFMHRPALARPVPLHQPAAEPLLEGGPVGARRLGPEPLPQGIVGVVGTLGRGEHVGQRLPHVGEPSGPVPPYVGQETRCAEPPAERHRRPHRQRRRPQRHDGVAVEERHRAVADVVALEAVPGGRPPGYGGQPSLCAPHRLRIARRSRREEKEEQIGRRDELASTVAVRIVVSVEHRPWARRRCRPAVSGRPRVRDPGSRAARRRSRRSPPAGSRRTGCRVPTPPRAAWG